MKTKILASLLPILIFCLSYTSQAQNNTNGKQISFLLGYTLVNVGSKIEHDKRIAGSFRLTKANLMWDFDVEYYTSRESFNRPFIDDGDFLFSTNTQKTSGFGFSIGIAKPAFKNTTIGFGLSGNYFDINQNLDESVHLFETGEEITDHQLSQKHRDARFFSPGMFVQTDLSFPIKKGSQFYLKQKFNWVYIGDQFDSSFWDSWISYTVYGGLRLVI